MAQVLETQRRQLRHIELDDTLGMKFERMVRLSDEEQEICFFAREL